MAEKRFRTRTQWYNTLLVIWVVPFLLLSFLISAISTGNFQPLAYISIVSVLVLVLAFVRDRSVSCTYTLLNDVLVLARGEVRLTIQPDEIKDASLIDRAAARDYIRTRSTHATTPKELQRSAQESFLRFSTVDIGLRSYTFGLGRGVIDKMPNARQDLVLLRLTTGEDLLLSPEFNQDFVEHMVRVLRRRDDQTESSAAQ